ncbi:MAG: hypothetical protein KDN05_20420 [Verrucomicrobiae bacterium]|nr:hypothetical protein [Verrucomicrobiae bacterium]
MSTTLAITGWGAVSPAGWGAAALADALASGSPCETSPLERKLGDSTVTTLVRRVPAGGTAPRVPRLRRASPIAKFAAAAVAEALGPERIALAASGERRIGVVFTISNGCVNYSNRFFNEVLADPSLASPILFPETVFNAPSSHLSAMLGGSAPNDTLISDDSGFFSGIDLAAEWIERGEVDGCLVVAAEELDWLSAEAVTLYSRRMVPAEGAGAIYLAAAEGPVVLDSLPDPVSYQLRSRAEAAAELRRLLDVADDGATLFVDSRSGVDRFDRGETAAWTGWQGPRWSPRAVLGETMGASAALQVVAAVEHLARGGCGRAVVATSGWNQQAAGAVFRTS